jgi:hypothetical protein
LQQWLHTLVPGRFDPFLPHCLPFLRKLGSCIAQNEAPKPMGLIEGEVLTNHSAQRQSNPVGYIYAQRVHKTHSVFSQLLKSIGPWGRIGTTMATRVIAQHLVIGL